MGAVVLIDSISKSEVCLYEKNVKIRCTSGFSARQCRDRYIEGVKGNRLSRDTRCEADREAHLQV